jgi:hypothetical protein
MTTSSVTSTRTGATLAAMYAGLVLTVAATGAPYVDRATGHVLADHVRSGYPAYSEDRVASAVTAWLSVLTIVGVLGLLGWIGAIWAVRTRRPWARPVATVLFALGAGTALTTLLTRDTSGEVGLAPLLGWIGMLPSVAGLVTVVLLWRHPPRSRDAVPPAGGCPRAVRR